MSIDLNSSADTRPSAISGTPKGTSHEPSSRPKRKRHWAMWVLALCIIGGGTFLLSQRKTTPANAAGGGSGKSGKKGRNGGAIPISAAKVTQGNIGEYINALGTVTPVYTVVVTSRVVGQLMDVRYREGQMVHKGELLAVVDPRPYQAAVTQAEGQLARDQALLKNAFNDVNRYKPMFEQHAIPEQQLVTQQATVEQDQGTVQLDQGTLDGAKVNLDYTKITAPIDGRVGLRTVDPGNIIQANGTTGIATITQLQPITVVFSMAEDYLGDVTRQMRAGHSLHVTAYDRAQLKEIAQGSVLTVDNQIDTNTGTVRVKATFPNSDFRLFPNEFVNAKLLVRTLSAVNLIPTAAIQRNNDASFLYVVQPDRTVVTRNITVATADGNTTAVTGVKPGETIVIDGFDRLQDGARVTIRPQTGPPTDGMIKNANSEKGKPRRSNTLGKEQGENQQPVEQK